MRKHYNIVLMDGGYFLFRNQSIGRGMMNASKLAGSFIQSIVKLIRESGITFDVGFIAFDKKPYHRTQLLNGRYKDSRDEFTEADVDEMESRVRQSVGEERSKLESQLNHMIETRKQLFIRHDAIEILKNLGTFGFTTLSYAGYEADDMARIIVDMYGDKYSILLLTIDSDWAGMVSPNVDFLRVRHRGIKDFYDINSIKSYPDYVNMVDEGLEEMGFAWYLQVLEALGIGHNDMRKCWHPEVPITIGEIIANWDDLDKLKDEYKFDVDTFRTQVNSFNFKEFPDYSEVVSKISMIKYHLDTPEKFNSKFIYELCTGVWFNYYRKVYDNIRNYSLLQLPW